MSEAMEDRGTPIYSLKGDASDDTEASRLGVYLNEIERQSEIVNLCFGRAWERAMHRATPPNDVTVWADLQSALFATIVIVRMLDPVGVRKHPTHTTQNETQTYATTRATKLRELLEIPDDFPLFAARKVRDSFEHVDERLDSVVLNDAASVADWYISDGKALITPPDKGGEHLGYGLRVFFPAGGVLYFENDLIDLFAVDYCLLELREIVMPKARDQLRNMRSGGKHMYGAQQYVYLMTSGQIADRCRSWLQERRERGHGPYGSYPIPQFSTD